MGSRGFARRVCLAAVAAVSLGAAALGAGAGDLRNEDIFVGIVNFRDRRCGVTLANLFGKARFPSRLSVGVIDYTHTEDDTSDCVRDFCKAMGGRGQCEAFKPQIKMVVVSFLDARGPAMARILQESLLKDQEFCLQVDAHSDFIQDWDVDAIKTWRALDNEYGVLSTAPPGLDKLQPGAAAAAAADPHVDHLCQATVTKMGMVRNVAPVRVAVSDIAQSRDKIIAPLWSAGFSFSKCHAVKKTPYDPSLLYLFDGEEYAMFARLWTRGYDVYTPSHTIVAHDYGTELFAKLLPEKESAMSAAGKKIDFWSWAKQGQSREYMRAMYDEAFGHVSTMLGSSTAEGGAAAGVGKSELALIGKYGLGNKRTLEQLIDFTGVDTRNGKVFADRCGIKLQIVPFERDADPWLEDGDVWGRAGEELEAGGGDIPLVDGGGVSFFSG